MSRIDKPQEPFLMIFPWGKVTGIMFLAALLGMVVFRMSQPAGQDVHRACFWSFIVTGVAGACGIYPVSKAWGKEAYGVLIGIMIASVIRLLISGAGVAIIAFFTNIHRSWFVLFLGIYYLLFLTVETWLAIWVLRNSQLKNREPSIHGNVWDVFS